LAAIAPTQSCIDGASRPKWLEDIPNRREALRHSGASAQVGFPIGATRWASRGPSIRLAIPCLAGLVGTVVRGQVLLAGTKFSCESANYILVPICSLINTL